MLSTKDFENEVYIYKMIMHTNGICSLLSSLLAGYMIIFRSPPQMGHYKFYLLNIVIFSAILDVYLGLLYSPQLLLPATGICSQGLFGTFDNFAFKQFEYLFFVFAMSGTAISIASAFVYRLACISQSIPKLHNKWSITLMVLIHIFYTFPICASALFCNQYDYPAVLDDMKKNFPTVYEFSLNHSCIYISTHVTPTACMIFACSILILTVICVSSGITLVCIILKKIKQNNKAISLKSLALHKQLTYSLIVQSALPICSIAIPFSILGFLVLIDQLDNILARISGSLLFIICSSHSTLNCISMILMMRPYRECLLNSLPIRFRQNQTNTIIMIRNVSSMVNQPSGLRTSRWTFKTRNVPLKISK